MLVCMYVPKPVFLYVRDPSANEAANTGSHPSGSLHSEEWRDFKRRISPEIPSHIVTALRINREKKWVL